MSVLSACVLLTALVAVVNQKLVDRVCSRAGYEARCQLADSFSDLCSQTAVASDGKEALGAARHRTAIRPLPVRSLTQFAMPDVLCVRRLRVLFIPFRLSLRSDLI